MASVLSSTAINSQVHADLHWQKICPLYTCLWLIHLNRLLKSKQAEGKTSYYCTGTQSTGQLNNPWMKSRRKKFGFSPFTAPMGLENKQQKPDCGSTLLLSLPPCSHSRNGTNKMMNVILQWPPAPQTQHGNPSHSFHSQPLFFSRITLKVHNIQPWRQEGFSNVNFFWSLQYEQKSWAALFRNRVFIFPLPAQLFIIFQ